MAPPALWGGQQKVEESEDPVFVLFWLLLEVRNRLIFNNSGKMKVVFLREGVRAVGTAVRKDTLGECIASRASVLKRAGARTSA